MKSVECILLVISLLYSATSDSQELSKITPSRMLRFSLLISGIKVTPYTYLTGHFVTIHLNSIPNIQF